MQEVGINVADENTIPVGDNNYNSTILNYFNSSGQRYAMYITFSSTQVTARNYNSHGADLNLDVWAR